MTLRHLRIFVAVAEQGTMHAAARALFLSQPAISQAVKELEAHYGGLLFERYGRRLVEEERSWRGEERELLAPLGELLGRYDGPAQRDGVAAVRARLEELADRAQADCRRQGRVYRALGLSGGAFLVILLL